jgi:eukaryotic-like serine/threonine-protein kinase
MPSDARDASLEPGARLDAYELLGLLAHGGMANVWLARQRMKHGLETIVAVKTILPELSLDPSFQAMFLDEARIACRVDHANVARLLDVGEARGHAYIVMEYVAGESLSRLRRTLARDRELVPLDVALRVASDLCAALHGAHELVDADGQPLKVVHRDVSPQNVLLSDGGVVKLIDFGVAKARHRFAAETSAGFAKGKARYMAPEQSEAAPIDRRADVWGAGAVLYELVAGRTPIDGPNDAAIFRTLLAGTDPVDPLPDSVPGPVRDVVHKALERSPEKRFPTARAMRDALEEAMEQLGLRATSITVERLCADRMGDRIAERKRQVEGWMRAASARDAAGVGPGSGSIRTTAAVTVPDGEDRSVVSVTHEPESAMAAPRKARSRWVVAATVVTLAAAAFGGAALLRQSPVPPLSPAQSSAPPPLPSALPPGPAPSQEPVAAVASVEPPPAPSASTARPAARPPRGHAPPRASAGPHDWGGIQ